MNAVELAPLVKQIDVRRSAPDAFALFTDEIIAWWPVKRHSRAKDAAGEVTVRVDLEKRAGGRMYETLNTGEERDWGEVLAWEQGQRLLLSFQMGREKKLAGEVEVRFEPIDANSCRVTLTHSYWERYADEGEKMRHLFSEGWNEVFIESFGNFAGRV